MNALDLIEDLLIDMGVASYTNKGWKASDIFPNLVRWNDKLRLKLTRQAECNIEFIGSRLYLHFRGVGYNFDHFRRIGYDHPVDPIVIDLADPESIDKIKTIIDIKNILKDTSSPA